jgi:hypothetical protein
MQAMLTYASMNLKKLATWLWKSGGSKHPVRDFVSRLIKIFNKLPRLQKETREFVFSLEAPKGAFFAVPMMKCPGHFGGML